MTDVGNLREEIETEIANAFEEGDFDELGAFECGRVAGALVWPLVAAALTAAYGQGRDDEAAGLPLGGVA